MSENKSTEVVNSGYVSIDEPEDLDRAEQFLRIQLQLKNAEKKSESEKSNSTPNQAHK